MQQFIRALFLLPIVWLLAVPVVLASGSNSSLSTKPIPMKKEHELPTRVPPLIEIGPRFLDTGNIGQGIQLPTGAVWQPALWVFGGYRTALQHSDDGSNPETQEWANRLDLFANLQLSGTERILLGVSPLHRDSRFTGHTRKGASPDSFNSEFNADITTLFFEGEFGEIFPDLDRDDRLGLDIGFAIGRQPLLFQEGVMINDTIDAVGVTRDTNIIPGFSPDLRVTALYGWNNIHRNDNNEDDSASIIGLFTETDFRFNTLNADFAYVFSDTENGGDLGLVGIATTQRIGHYNTAFWFNYSWAPDSKSAVANNGALLFLQVSRTLPRSENLIYANAYWGIDQYTSAARDSTSGGPLGQLGILYASVDLGNYGAALDSRPDDSVGFAVGYQMFFNNERTQLVLELGGREGTVSNQQAAIAVAARLQFGLGGRYVLRFDGFLSNREGGVTGAGLRSEFAVQF